MMMIYLELPSLTFFGRRMQAILSFPLTYLRSYALPNESWAATAAVRPGKVTAELDYFGLAPVGRHTLTYDGGAAVLGFLVRKEIKTKKSKNNK